MLAKKYANPPFNVTAFQGVQSGTQLMQAAEAAGYAVSVVTKLDLVPYYDSITNAYLKADETFDIKRMPLSAIPDGAKFIALTKTGSMPLPLIKIDGQYVAICFNPVGGIPKQGAQSRPSVAHNPQEFDDLVQKAQVLTASGAPVVINYIPIDNSRSNDGATVTMPATAQAAPQSEKQAPQVPIGYATIQSVPTLQQIACQPASTVYQQPTVVCSAPAPQAPVVQNNTREVVYVPKKTNALDWVHLGVSVLDLGVDVFDAYQNWKHINTEHQYQFVQPQATNSIFDYNGGTPVYGASNGGPVIIDGD
ncbi:MAG TPA: hypothetical protein VEF04_08970, partial [Blastocatellia bacterium]|nr:hypothetical protein [Blastocatellia bacterium]